MSQLLKRSEVPTEHTWKLEDLFADQKAWDQEYEEVTSLTKKASEFQGKLNKPESLKACFELEDEVSLKIERLLCMHVCTKMKTQLILHTKTCPKSTKAECACRRSSFLCHTRNPLSAG